MLAAIFLENRWAIARVYATLVIASTIHLLMPRLFGEAIDAVVAVSKGLPLDIGPILVWALADIGETLFNTARYWYDTVVFGRIDLKVVTRVIQDQYAAGADTSTVNGRAGMSNRLTNFFESQVPWIVHSLFASVGGMVLLAATDLRVFFACLVFMLPVAARAFWLHRRISPLLQSGYDLTEANASVIESRDMNRVQGHYQAVLDNHLKVNVLHTTSFAVMSTLKVVLTGVVLWLFSQSAEVTVGEVYAILAYIFQVTDNIDNLPNLVAAVSDVKNIAARLDTATQTEDTTS